MGGYPHLILPRAQAEIERRRRPGFAGPRPPREPAEQARRVTAAVEGVLQRRARLPVAVNPALVIRVRTIGVVPEEEWERAGLTLLGSDADTNLVLFASDAALQEFRRRLGQYEQGVPEGQRNPAYAGLIGAIEEFGPVRPEDRLGPLLRGRGFTPDSFAEDSVYRLDVELWDTGTQLQRVARVNELSAIIENRGGQFLDRYVGRTLTLFRVSGSGAVIRLLLDLDDVASIDEPPIPEDLTGQLLDLNLADFAEPRPPELDSPRVGVLDTGLSFAHPLISPAVGSAIGVPARLRTDDVKGHGTRVAAIAVYGDVRRCAENRQFAPQIRIHSAKIINDQGQFDDERLIVGQTRDAIVELHGAGCRIFNISLCHPTFVYTGAKVSTWAAALDEIARELDVLIVVSAGNYQVPQREAEARVHDYPGYLLTPEARILEPSTAAIALTVGALAETANLPERADGNVGLQPVAAPEEPSPFTRTGFGVNDIIKPDLCDFGGNLVFDGAAQNMVRYDECAILTFNSEYLRRLFMTAVGTSLAAPRVTHKAAMVLKSFPTASANLLRALLASSALIPPAARNRLLPLGEDAVLRTCGHGVPEISRAVTSAESRVVLYADEVIGLDRFFVYEIPMPAEFTQTAGERYIQVVLAYDPPTRHTRADYLGTTMSFRLIRGATLDQVIEHFRRRPEADGPVPEMPGRFNCGLLPRAALRDRCTLQRGRFVMRQNPREDYGDTYFLVVRCERNWAGEEDAPQRFAVVVEVGHPGVGRLYERIRERVRVRVRV